MKLYAIAAVDQANGIGLDGSIPWRIKQDMRQFKEKTTGRGVVMGRRTWESLGGVRLAKRYNMVLTSDPGKVNGADFVAGDIHEAIQQAEDIGLSELWIIGGTRVYWDGLGQLDGLYLTIVEGDYKCDTHFVKLIEQGWTIVTSAHVPAKDGEPAHTYVHLAPRPSSPLLGSHPVATNAEDASFWLPSLGAQP